MNGTFSSCARRIFKLIFSFRRSAFARKPSGFAIYGPLSSDALARGGRYDEVGAVFGRRRPAVGFSLDLKALAEAARPLPAANAVLAPWSEDPGLRAAVRRLRAQGQTVLSVLPGHQPEAQAFECDRELAFDCGQWVLRSLSAQAQMIS